MPHHEIIYTSAEVLALSREQLSTISPEIWGGYIRHDTITLLVGESSAGKTVLLYNLAYHLAAQKDFLGIPAAKPVRVLHIDFEGNAEIRALNLGAIGTHINWDMFIPPESFFSVAPQQRGPQLMKILLDLFGSVKYDFVIVDSLMEAYPVLDENSNDDGNLQMVAWRRFAHQTSAGILLVHNTGLKPSDDPNRAMRKGLSRGASSRVDRADIVLNYTVEGGDERMISCVKSRSGNIGEQIKVRFDGTMGYDVVESSLVTSTTVSEAQHLIMAQLHGGKDLSRHQLMTNLLVAHGSSRAKSIDRGLEKLLNAGSIVRIRKGVYQLSAKT